ncbi:MAG: AAA family ATPase [Candidatus Eisenbacteria bacterium]|nr:AAA family ATPase [Candidatus Eisenbacteria bacterium]
MYCQYYGFSEDPFQLTPDPQFLYLDEVYREAMAHLEYGVTSGRGYVLLTGEVGTGKTTLIHSFLDQHREDLLTAFIFSTAMNFVELLKMIHEDFETGFRGEDSEAILLIELNRFLLRKYHEGVRCVLILDEAQNLSVELLEKIRMLSNLEARKSKLVQTVLVGQPELVGKLEREDLRQLKQRVAVRFDIPPMTADRTENYIRHRLGVAGSPDRGLFTDQAVRLVQKEAGGIPRLINVICSNSLLLGFGMGVSRIDERVIGEVIRDMNRGLDRFRGSEKPERPVAAPLPASPPAHSLPATGDAPLTAREGAAYLRVSVRTLRELFRSGSIPCVKVGGGWRVLRSDLDSFVRGVAAGTAARHDPAGESGSRDREEDRPFVPDPAAVPVRGEEDGR